MLQYFKIRGCCWIDYARYCRLTDHFYDKPDWRSFYLSFRIFQRYE
jgi:hypothetical protein